MPRTSVKSDGLSGAASIETRTSSWPRTGSKPVLSSGCRPSEAMSFFGFQIPPPFAPFSHPAHQMDKHPRDRIKRNENEEN